MDRYDVVIGLMQINDMALPIIKCQILADGELVAHTISELMGLRIYELKKTRYIPKYQIYQMN